MVMGGKPVALQPISDSWKGQDVIHDLDISSFWHRIGEPSLPTGDGSFHWTAKSGPNGPALMYSLIDLLALKERPDLCKAISFWLNDETRESFETWLEAIDERLPKLAKVLKLKYKRNKLKLRKLSVKADKEAKSRVFAILDYWSQSALKGLHQNLYKILRKLPADCTYDQGRHLGKMAALNSGSRFFSFDLSSATDRFPLQVQKRLLAKLVGLEAADQWEEIMVKHPFEYQGKSIYYGTGQPMGAHSSWPLFTLTHHLVVHTAALRCNLREFEDYCILGDDVVIYHEDVAATYVKLMTDLGVEISDSKSHVSKDTFEFAKRWFHQGTEVSPYPLMGLLEVQKSWPLLVEFLGHQVPMKGYLALVNFSDPVMSSLGEILTPYKRLRETLIKRIKIVSLFPNWWVNDMKDEAKVETWMNRLYSVVQINPPSVHPLDWLDWFTEQSYNKVREQIAKRGTISVNKSMQWRNALYDIEGDGEDDQSLTLSSEWIRSVPPLAVIREMAIQSQTQLDLRGFTLDPDVFWTKWRTIEMMFLPKFNGILPARKRDGMAKAQSFLALEIGQSVLPKSSELEESQAPEPVDDAPFFFPF
uniref:RNA-dependent RNA polymerase n=1 Tax=Plasmopara viticola lesion associated mitovirus 21 TaxID=2719447 RepID=A0A6G9RWI9_9VIRU|nr:RNA-dependent RNA polymerase [Plasmopara viticola lesion associated mitovirus 21]